MRNLAIARTPRAEDDEDDESETSPKEDDCLVLKTRMAKIAKIASTEVLEF